MEERYISLCISPTAFRKVATVLDPVFRRLGCRYCFYPDVPDGEIVLLLCVASYETYMAEAKEFADSHSIPVLEVSLGQISGETGAYELIRPFVSGTGTDGVEALLRVKLETLTARQRVQAEPITSEDVEGKEDPAGDSDFQDTAPEAANDERIRILNRRIGLALGAASLFILFWLISMAKNLSLKDQMESALNEKDRIISVAADAYPIVIRDMSFSNRKQGGDVISKYNEKIYSYKTQFIDSKLDYYGMTDGYINLDVKFITPNETLSKGSSSPKGYSFSQGVYVYKGYNSVSLNSWGGSKSGHWSKGTYRYEVWCDGRVLYVKYFTVH